MHCVAGDFRKQHCQEKGLTAPSSVRAGSAPGPRQLTFSDRVAQAPQPRPQRVVAHHWWDPRVLQGLRWALIVAAGLTSLGSWVKVGSVGRDRFWVTMVGQVLVAVGQVFMLFLPPRLASVWFGPHQVSLACSMGFIGILVS